MTEFLRCAQPPCVRRVVACVDRRVEEPGEERQEELLPSSGGARRLQQPAQEAAAGQDQEEELHPLARRVAQLARQTASQHQQPLLHHPPRPLKQQPPRGPCAAAAVVAISIRQVRVCCDYISGYVRLSTPVSECWNVAAAGWQVRLCPSECCFGNRKCRKSMVSYLFTSAAQR